jgi:ankyrin repeat protein
MGIAVLCCILGCKASAHEHTFPELSSLGNAARHQDLMRVKALLVADADVNAREKNGETALYDALECGQPNCANVPIIDALLEHGADLNLNLPWWGTPLTFSLTRDYGNPAATLELIKRGATVSKVCNGEESDLSFATQNFELDVMQALLERGADPNCKDSHSAGPLYWAAINGRADAVELLLKHGANPNEIAPNGQSILQSANTTNPAFAVQMEFTDTRKILIQNGEK